MSTSADRAARRADGRAAGRRAGRSLAAILDEAAESFRSRRTVAAAAENIQSNVDQLAKALKIEASAGHAYREVPTAASFRAPRRRTAVTELLPAIRRSREAGPA